MEAVLETSLCPLKGVELYTISVRGSEVYR